jgi:predicted metal-dependent enzyme (double-stranded beta helix superfamily)
MSQTLLLQNDGNWLDWSDLPRPIAPTIATPDDRPYRLYRFLTEVEDILLATDDPQTQLQRIIPLVQQLLEQSPWLYFNPLMPDPVTGWAVETLYDEPDFPLTVQLVAWAPGSVSPIHNHGAWAIVALLQGEETNYVWQRSATTAHPNDPRSVGDHRIAQSSERTLTSGDIVGILPAAIHQIQAGHTRPTISFNLYGPTDYSARYEFDPNAHTASNF